MTSRGRLVIEPLGKHHDRAAFSCGVPELDQYLRARAGQDSRRRISRVFVCREEGSTAIAGFYSLSSLSIDADSLPPERARKLPRQPVPAALLGRLAVSQTIQGSGLGKILLADAVKRTLSASQSIAIYALVVDAKDESAKRFYERFGFIPFGAQPSRLFLPLASVAD